MKAQILILMGALVTVTLVSTASVAGSGPQSGYPGGYGADGGRHGWQPAAECEIVYETRYRIEKVTKYREQLCTVYVEQECQVPRQVVKTEYKKVPEVVCRTVTEYKLQEVDKGHYVRQSYVDAWGCTKYKEVWCPQIVTIKVPCEKVIKETVIKKVPYQVTCTVYETVVKKVPVTQKKMVPYVVEKKIPYKVAKQVCHPRKPRSPWTPASYHH